MVRTPSPDFLSGRSAVPKQCFGCFRLRPLALRAWLTRLSYRPRLMKAGSIACCRDCAQGFSRFWVVIFDVGALKPHHMRPRKAYRPDRDNCRFDQ
jgi:hypothetical protein